MNQIRTEQLMRAGMEQINQKARAFATRHVMRYKSLYTAEYTHYNNEKSFASPDPQEVIEHLLSVIIDLNNDAMSESTIDDR